MRMIKQAIILVILSIIISISVNTLSPNKISLIGEYRELSGNDGPIVPPNVMEGDPPFIAIDVAQMEFSMGQVLFVDAREFEDFECGTIPGSVNIPFDYLPEENLGKYLDSALGQVPLDKHLIIFCSGEECDLSLHLARNLQALNYTNLSIFFGGSREWESFELEMERRVQCEE